MSREAVLRFIENYYERHGKAPSIRVIANNVHDVNKTNFYDYFSGGINEALNTLGIEGFIEKPVKAMEARKAKTDSDYRITLNESQSLKILAISYMEKKNVPLLIDEMIEQRRDIREILDLIEVDKLDVGVLDAMLHPNQVFNGMNVSTFANRPWVFLDCPYCDEPVIVAEAWDPIKWKFEIKPFLNRYLHPAHLECRPRAHSIPSPHLSPLRTSAHLSFEGKKSSLDELADTSLIYNQ